MFSKLFSLLSKPLFSRNELVWYIVSHRLKIILVNYSLKISQHFVSNDIALNPQHRLHMLYFYGNTYLSIYSALYPNAHKTSTTIRLVSVPSWCPLHVSAIQANDYCNVTDNRASNTAIYVKINYVHIFLR